MKKIKRTGAVHVDDRLPGKPAAPSSGTSSRQSDAAVPPAYDGPSKSDAAPERRGRALGEVKVEAGSPTRLRRNSTAPDFGDQTPGAHPDRGDGDGDGNGNRNGAEQYIRLRMRLRDDRLTVLDSHLVDGPLSQAQGFSTPNVYEVTVAGRLVHAGELPDLGLQRSFARPGAVEDGHFITERPIAEFTARIPANEVTPETLSTIAVRVHRVKDEARNGRLGVEPLGEQFPRELRQVAELVGLPESVLPRAIIERGGRTPSL